MGTSRPISGREAWSWGPSAHSTGGRFQNFLQAPSEGLFTNKFFLFTKRPLTRARGVPLAQRAGSTPLAQRAGSTALQCGGASAQRADGRSPTLYKPPPCPKFPFYSAQTRKKERKEWKGEEKAAKPCSHIGLEVYFHSNRIIT
jgi:hypothetical protein